MMKVDRKFRLARIWSNQELRKVAHLFSDKVINVSAGENIDKEGSSYDKYFQNASEFWMSNYGFRLYRGYEGRKHEIEIDLSRDIPSDLISNFEVVFNHTTLEHIFDVFTAFKNICALSNDIVIIVVPFAQEQHENVGYLDYWRFTPTCMRKLFEINGMKVIYEATNNDFNAATYLFYIASKKPHKWEDQMPPYNQVQNAANWIGVKQKQSLVSKLKGLFK